MASIAFFLEAIGLRGGVKAVYKLSNELIVRGHEVFIYYTDGDWKYDCRAKFVRYVDPEDVALTHDSYVATFWRTAETVANLPVPNIKKFYYIQHHEARLAQDYDRVQATYELPLTKIAISKWVAESTGSDITIYPPFFYQKFHPALVKDIDVLMFNTKIEWKGAALSQRVWDGLQKMSVKSVRVEDATDEELISLYSRAKIFIFTSTVEGFGAVPLEAMLSGCVVLSTRCTGIDYDNNILFMDGEADFLRTVQSLLASGAVPTMAVRALHDGQKVGRFIEEHCVGMLERVLMGNTEQYRADAKLGHRIYPEYIPIEEFREHLFRYDFARQYCVGKRVLDACCGTGYGTSHLAPVALHVVGVERSPLAFSYACRAWHRPNIQFMLHDFLELRNSFLTVDALVAFEALEHFKDGLEFLQTCSHLLLKDGLLLLSVPPHALTRSKFHLAEYSASKLEDLLESAGFEVLEVYSQTASEAFVPGYRDGVVSWVLVARKR